MAINLSLAQKFPSQARLALRSTVRFHVAQWPSLYLPLRRIFNGGEGDLDRDTELLIEGYPRSGNSFAEAAFRLSQTKSVKLAHHSHAPAFVIQSVRWGIPAIVLFRNPIDAALSFMMMCSKISPQLAFSEYTAFYSRISDYRYGFLLVDFDTVTDNFGSVIQAVNTRFDTAFGVFSYSQHNERAVFDLIDELSRKRGTITEGHLSYSPRASESERHNRAKRKQELLMTLERRDLRKHIDRAVQVWELLKSTKDL